MRSFLGSVTEETECFKDANPYFVKTFTEIPILNISYVVFCSLGATLHSDPPFFFWAAYCVLQILGNLALVPTTLRRFLVIGFSEIESTNPNSAIDWGLVSKLLEIHVPYQNLPLKSENLYNARMHFTRARRYLN